jgi:hypothetical protein
MADETWKRELGPQVGAAVDMLENAIKACPESLWSDRARFPEYWYLAYHVLFFLDLYLSDSMEGFAPPAPFTMAEMDPAGVMPDRVYTKDELLIYLDHGRRKLRKVMDEFTDAWARRHRTIGNVEGTGLEMLLYNLRHVQHHAAQLNLILRQVTNSAAPAWVRRAKA